MVETGGSPLGGGIDLGRFCHAFFDEAGENLDRMEQMLLQLDLEHTDVERMNAIFRCTHSVKGGAATFGFADVAGLAHDMETLLDKLRHRELQPTASLVDRLLASGDALKAMLARHQGHHAEPAGESAWGFFDGAPGAPGDGAPVAPGASPAGAAALAAIRSAESGTLRVSVAKVDRLINLVSELIITQAMLARSSKAATPQHRIEAGLAELERHTRDLQQAVMSIRMTPMSMVFNRFPRMLRDLAGKLGKRVELVVRGEATELDKGLVEKIADPLTHLVRNSCDHGIESPAERRARGKPEHGTITLVAAQQGGSIVIEVRDDGQGLSRAKLIAKARQRGLQASDSMSDAEVHGFVFAPGFSTAEQVTDVSGRGVGMDVVKANIASFGGTVEIESAEGCGMTVRVRLPLTLAIMATAASR